MAADRSRRRFGRPARPARRRGPVFRAFERVVLGFGMSLIAWFVERRLVKALKQGSVQPAPRTAAESEAFRDGGELTEGELTATTNKIDHQAQGQDATR